MKKLLLLASVISFTMFSCTKSTTEDPTNPGGGGTSSSTLPRRAHSVDWSGPVLKEALCMEQLVAGH